MFMEDMKVCVLGISTMVSIQISLFLVKPDRQNSIRFRAVARLGASSPLFKTQLFIHDE